MLTLGGDGLLGVIIILPPTKHFPPSIVSF